MITYFGSGAKPSDNTNFNASATPCVVTPPASMLSGDLVYLICDLMDVNSGKPLSISQAGGQSWNTAANKTVIPCNYAAFWCQFNGTWSASPSVTYGGITESAGMQVAMVVFRSSALVAWSVDVADTSTPYSAPSTPYNCTLPSQTTISATTVTIASWIAGLTNEPAFALQTAGWTNPGGQTQWRNTSKGSISVAYLINTSAGATGSVTNQESVASGFWGDVITFTDGSAPPSDTLLGQAWL